jgi:hypothetical protein
MDAYCLGSNYRRIRDIFYGKGPSPSLSFDSLALYGNVSSGWGASEMAS